MIFHFRIAGPWRAANYGGMGEIPGPAEIGGLARSTPSRVVNDVGGGSVPVHASRNRSFPAPRICPEVHQWHRLEGSIVSGFFPQDSSGNSPKPALERQAGAKGYPTETNELTVALTGMLTAPGDAVRKVGEGDFAWAWSGEGWDRPRSEHRLGVKACIIIQIADLPGTSVRVLAADAS